MSRRILIACVPLLAATWVRAGGPETVTLDVRGMTCPTCPLTVKVALEKQPGVADVKVDYRHNTAEVTFDPAKVSVDRLAKAVTDAGFPASPKR
ncbi:MAG TPA: cation transporter [Usitatibacter sp.]|nr:cation transporter [Usitatibacter sp.]